MTFAKTGIEFPDDCANIGLSDAAYRTHHEGITWLFTVERTDCLIPKHLARRFVGSCNAAVAIGELLAVGFWADRGECWEVVHQGEVIRGGIVAQQNKRDRDRRAQQGHRKRAREAVAVSDDVSAYPDRQTNRQTERADERQSQEQEDDNLRIFARERGR